jgi:protein-S-isoprenylcysteine O-methyltransferase Ste14
MKSTVPTPRKGIEVMQRALFVLYGVICYVLFVVVYAYLAAFFGDFAVPKTIDGPHVGLAPTALVVNVLLVLAFSLQHSVMARPGFKRVWTKIVPQAIERSTYVLFSNAVLALLVWGWQPMDGIIWNVTHPTGRAILWTLFALGWFGVPAVSLMINHFDLFGMRQVSLHWQGKAYESLPFRTPFLYRYMRHPLYVAWAIAFWSTPTMTVGHALLAAVLTAYMAIAVYYEERDLVAHFREEYREYQRNVPKFVPRLGGPVAQGENAVEGETPRTATSRA